MDSLFDSIDIYYDDLTEGEIQEYKSSKQKSLAQLRAQSGLFFYNTGIMSFTTVRAKEKHLRKVSVNLTTVKDS